MDERPNCKWYQRTYDQPDDRAVAVVHAEPTEGEAHREAPAGKGCEKPAEPHSRESSEAAEGFRQQRHPTRERNRPKSKASEKTIQLCEVLRPDEHVMNAAPEETAAAVGDQSGKR